MEIEHRNIEQENNTKEKLKINTQLKQNEIEQKLENDLNIKQNALVQRKQIISLEIQKLEQEMIKIQKEENNFDQLLKDLNSQMNTKQTEFIEEQQRLDNDYNMIAKKDQENLAIIEQENKDGEKLLEELSSLNAYNDEFTQAYQKKNEEILALKRENDMLYIQLGIFKDTDLKHKQPSLFMFNTVRLKSKMEERVFLKFCLH